MLVTMTELKSTLSEAKRMLKDQQDELERINELLRSPELYSLTRRELVGAKKQAHDACINLTRAKEIAELAILGASMADAYVNHQRKIVLSISS